MENNYFDVIVIGSGIGGLSTAGLLSKINKKKVLVLEKHYEIGGLTHEFKRGPYSWDVGLHYVGNLPKRLLDNIGYKMFNYLTDGKLKWNNMPKIFDKLIFPDFKINIQESVEGYKNSLLEQFPEEEKAINKYIKDVHKIRLWYLFYFFSRFSYPPIKQFFKFLCLFNNKKALMTTKQYLDKYIKNEKLKTVLAARWGNYGVPPEESAFAIHSLVEHHYYSGGIFPDGGAEKIATYIEKIIEKQGGMIVANREVTEILVKNNKAYGVRVRNLSSENKEITEYYSNCIISDAGAKNTYLKLLPQNLNLKIQNELRNFFTGYSGLDLYLGLKESPEKLGIKSENYWITDSLNIDVYKGSNLNILNNAPCYLFLSFPSMKSGKPGAHTADIVTIFPSNLFEKWKKEYWKERDNEYYQIKEKLTESLLNLVEKYLPGFKNLVIYKEMATPLTIEHFANCQNGVFYGLPEIPARYKIKDLQVKTPIKNLYLTGADILCNGILPSFFSGMGTVSYLNGPFGIMKVMSNILSYRESKENKIYEERETIDKKIGKLIDKKNISSNIIELTFNFKEKIKFIPGQHIKLKVADDEWRAYSVAKTENENLKLVIDTRPDGYGSNFAKNIKIGEKALFRFGLTDLIYHKSERDIIFIATGTGLIPFLHIMDEIKNDYKNKIILIFGCMRESDNFIHTLIDPYIKCLNIEVNICIEKPDSNGNFFKGRVTDFIINKKYNTKQYDFYICGHPHMTEATVKLLRNLGADRIFY